MIVVDQDGNTTSDGATRTLRPREHKLDVLEAMGEISYKVIVYPIIGLFYLVAFAMGTLAVAIMAVFDYAAFGFVGPLAIMTAFVMLGRIFGWGGEHKGGFVPVGAGAHSAGVSGAASCASSSFSSCGGGDSSGGCSGGSAC